MKILHVINSLNTGGAEKLIIETLPLIKNQGVSVELLIYKWNDYPFEKKFINENDIKVHKSKYNSNYSPLNIFYTIPLLKKYDIIHVHLFPAMYWVAIAKFLSFSKTKLIFTEHNTTNRRLEKWYFRTIDKMVYSQYSKIISIAEKVHEMLLQKIKLDHTKVVLIKNGLNLEAINNAMPLQKQQIHTKIQNHTKIIIQVSRFQPQKDQQTLINAMKYLPENVVLLLVGDGELKASCEQLTNDLNLNHKVFFLGVRMDVPRLLKSADIVVLSSHFEGLSLASIEALATGRPFVASNVPGLTEVVQDAGVLFEQGNAQQLAQKLTELLNNQTLYNTVAASCLQKSLNYDINLMVAQQIALYNNIQKN